MRVKLVTQNDLTLLDMHIWDLIDHYSLCGHLFPPVEAKLFVIDESGVRQIEKPVYTNDEP